MTKIRNTKKGMAKKTLSISLAVAMLATSNVPVWAAEDLFTDGEVAVEAFTAEEVVVETEDAIDAQVVESKYPVTWKTNGSKTFVTEPEWNHYEYKVKIADEKGVSTGFSWRWLDENGNASPTWTGGALNPADVDADGYYTIVADFPVESIGNTYKLQVFEGTPENMLWNEVSPAITVQKRVITATIDASGIEDGTRTVHYNGKQITTVPKIEISDAGWSFFDKDNVKDNGVSTEGMSFENFHSISGDPVNAVEVSEDVVRSEGDIVSPYYTGKAYVDFIIWRKDIASASEAVKVELPKYNYQYTGADIIVEKEKVTVTEKLTDKVVKNVVKDNFLVGKDATATPDHGKMATILHEGVLKNYNAATPWEKNGAEYVKPVTSVKVDKRNLADPANTTISISTVTQEALGNGTTIDATALRDSNMTIKDYDGTDITDSLGKHVNVYFMVNGKATSSIEVHDGDTITAYVSGDSTTNFTDDVAEVTFKVVDHDLANAKFAHEKEFFDALTDEMHTYTGKQITLGLTKDNLTSKLGALKALNGTVLSSDTQYDLNIVFGENVNYGKGQIIINGKGDYAGTQKVMEFDILQRAADKLNVPEKVTFNASYLEADEYTLNTSVTAAVGADTLTVPAEDYKVERIFVDANDKEITDKYEGNKVGNYVKTIVTLTNKVGNFKFDSFTDTTLIVNKAITEADVILEKTEYTYNAAKIMPEYKVVVDGVTLEEGKDYTVVVTQNDRVGEANLTITGKGEFDTTTSVTKKFNIVPANVSDIKIDSEKIVYNGKRHVGTATTKDLVFTIAGNEINLEKDEFVITYPTSKLANINAGNGLVTLKPAKNNANFVGADDLTFVINPAVLTGGTITGYDKNGSKVDFSKAFNYDGTAHEFASVEYTPDTSVVKDEMKFTANDYEIIYRDNVYGKADHEFNADGWNDVAKRTGSVIVVAKGNYVGGAEDYVCADKSVVKSVAKTQEFTINAKDIQWAEAVVENGQYAEGKNVTPVVKVTYNGKTLVEGVDYTLAFKDSDDRTDVTNGKELSVRITGKNGYYGYISNRADKDGWFVWGIDKFNLKDAEVIVKGTDADPYIKVLNNDVVVDPDEYDITIAEGKATITAKATSKHYTGEAVVDIKEALEKPGKPVIAGYEVVGNKVTLLLEDDVEGAIGYDFVIDTKRDCTETYEYYQRSKNNLKTNGVFTYVDQGVYFAYCHAYTRDENGKKVFGEWSEPKIFSVTAITPERPEIEGYTVKGNTVTVTYTKADAADGYDVVLGTTYGTVLGERRPLQYGELVRKNIKGNTVTAVFKNVPKGTYYAGLHAFNRTSEDGKKVFSPWSDIKTIRVK